MLVVEPVLVVGPVLVSETWCREMRGCFHSPTSPDIAASQADVDVGVSAGVLALAQHCRRHVLVAQDQDGRGVEGRGRSHDLLG